MPVGGFRIGMEVKRMFFDRPKVIAAIDSTTRRAFGYFGGWVRKTARWSIRKGKAREVSSPGQPPIGHTGFLRRHIYYSLDWAQRSVVIGPIKLHRNVTYGAKTMPEALEYGGTVWGKRTGRGGRGGRKVRMHYAARPYMQPAFAKALDRQDEFWRKSVKR